MNRLKLLVAAALLGLPLVACEEGTAPPPIGEIEGQVVIEGEGIDGVSVTLSSGAATTTSGGGYYSFADVEGGTYTITISGLPEDGSFDATTAEVTIAQTGQTITRNFTGSYIRTASLMGMVTIEGKGLSDVTVSISGRQEAQVLTDENGQFTFTGLRAGNYTVEISGFDPTDVAFSNNSNALSVSVGESKVVPSFDGVYVRESIIAGQVSVEGNGLADVTVSLQGMGEDESQMTDAGGQFNFSDLRAGEYQIAISGFDAREYEFETTSATVQVEHGRTANVPFEGIMLRTASIMGQVSAEGEGLEDVVVSLSGAGEKQTVITDASGQYAFTDLPAGNFQVGISGYDTNYYSFETTSKNVALALGETERVPFEGILLRTSGISGRVSVEDDGLGDVTVTLSGEGMDDMTRMTDAAGQYAFAGLAEGSYTVVISGYDDGAYVFDPTSMDVDLGNDDEQIVSFKGAHARTASISGMIFVDEATKNNVYDEGENALAAAGVAVVLVGPAIDDRLPGATDASGAYAFTDLRAGPYQLVVLSPNPAVPADYAYGGSPVGYEFDLGVGEAATQNLPFDITHQTVNFSVTLKAGDATGPALEGATITLYSDLAGQNMVMSGTTGANGTAAMRFAREGTSGNTVYASVAAPAGDYHADDMMQAVMWDPSNTMASASNDGKIVNLRVDMAFNGETVTTAHGGGMNLAGWAVEVTSGDEAAEGAPAALGADGTASYSATVGADELPVTYRVALAANQGNALDDGESYDGGMPLEHTHTGLSLPGTANAGTLVATFTTQTLMVYVYEENDQVRGYTGNILGGDARMSGKIDVDIRYIAANGRSRAFTTDDGIKKTDSGGVVTFAGVPADRDVIVIADENANAGNIELLGSDELATYEDLEDNGVMGGAFGAEGGFSHTVELCPLTSRDTDQRFGECGTFAFVNTYSVTGQATREVAPKSGDGFGAEAVAGMAGTTVNVNPVENENLAGNAKSFTAAASDNAKTPLDETMEFDFGQMAAGMYTISVPAGWVADSIASPHRLAGDINIDVKPTTGYVYGTVKDAKGFRVEGVTVTANGHSATTDALGRYVVEGFGSNSKAKTVVKASKEEYGAPANTSDFAANTPHMADFVLEGAQETASISGRVTSVSTGAAVSGVLIEVNGSAPLNATKGLTTGSDGTYTAVVAAVAAGGTVNVTASKSGMYFTPAAHTVSAVAGSAISGIDFTGFNNATISGRVLDAVSGGPMAGVTVTAVQVAPGTGTDTGGTGVNGSFSLSVPFGQYNVTAAKPGYDIVPATQSVNVGPGEQKSIEDFTATGNVMPQGVTATRDLEGNVYNDSLTVTWQAGPGGEADSVQAQTCTTKPCAWTNLGSAVTDGSGTVTDSINTAAMDGAFSVRVVASVTDGGVTVTYASDTANVDPINPSASGVTAVRDIDPDPDELNVTWTSTTNGRSEQRIVVSFDDGVTWGVLNANASGGADNTELMATNFTGLANVDSSGAAVTADAAMLEGAFMVRVETQQGAAGVWTASRDVTVPAKAGG